MALIRTFLAVEISDEVRSRAVELIQSLSTLAEGVRWVRPENLHVTLQFLGEVEDRELNDVCRGASRAAANVSAFSCDCGSVGAFPDLQRPATVWIGAKADSGMGSLHEQVETAMAELGFPRERRPFKPHITLGRIRRRGGNQKLTELLDELSVGDYGTFPVKELVVFSSERQKGGPVYTALAHCPLA